MDLDSHFLDLSRLSEGECVFYDRSLTGFPGWLAYRDPVRILSAQRTEDVVPCLEEASGYASTGGWSAGFVCYEGAPALDPALVTHNLDRRPLAWFALYDAPPTRHRDLLPWYEPVRLAQICPELDFDDYQDRFDQVKSALGDGVSYQVNLTFRLRIRLDAPAYRFFASRCGVDPPRYAAYLSGGDWSVASFSPELFVERRGDQIVSRPMKGTAQVPPDPGLIKLESERLSHDPKSRAENVMIVDMVRNDLGSFCETGSVQVRDLLRVERHRELLQMTSTVCGRSSAPTSDLIRHLFPAASVTGAPKASTMGLIRDLETSPRGVYCGAIGAMDPRGQRFSVGIRTAWLREDGHGEFGVGSGIVWDSDPGAEYQECLAKAERLVKPATQWSLVEAMPSRALSGPSSHLDRLTRSADWFDVPLDRARLEADLRNHFPSGGKVRVSLRLDGDYEITSGPGETKGPSIRAALARTAIQSADPNLRYKSTSRSVFQDRLNECPEADEVLLWNESGELTEFTRGNVLLEIDRRLWTPRPESGCLAGVGVQRLLEEGHAGYRRLMVEDLQLATAVYFVNSVVGLLPVELGVRQEEDPLM